MAIDRLGFYTAPEVVDFLTPGGAADLSGDFQVADPTLANFAGLAWSAGTQVPVLTAADTFALRTVGAATANDLLDRAAGDGRYALTGSGVTSFNTRTGAVTLTLADVSTAVGFGTGVATALGVNVGSAGAFVTFNGAGGTPSSLTLTNASGLPIAGLTSSTSTALGVGSLELGDASDTTLARSSAGNVTIEGNLIYRAGGTDVPVTDGGTGASDAATARSNLGLIIGTNVQAWDADLDAVSASSIAAAWTNYTPTLTAGAGSFTTTSIVAARYLKAGKFVYFRITILITTNGTANTYFTITAPFTTANIGAGAFQAIYCTTTGAVGLAGRAALDNNSTTIFVTKYDGTYLGQDGLYVHLTGGCEIA